MPKDRPEWVKHAAKLLAQQDFSIRRTDEICRQTNAMIARSLALLKNKVISEEPGPGEKK